MDLQTLLQNFNPSKFLVYNCLLIFSMLFALRLDNTIQLSYWFVFSPLWLWKALAVSGALIGTIVWCRDPLQRLSQSSYIQFKTMLISLSLQLLLLMFEVLSADKLETGRHAWVLAFIPLVFVSLLSVAVCVWSMRHDREYDLELFCAVNVVQFVLIALRLDGFIGWSWSLVLTPLWFVLSFCVFGVLYAIVFALILIKSSDIPEIQRRTNLHQEIAHSLVVFPLFLFLVLICHKLDGPASSPSFLAFSSTTGLSVSVSELDYVTVCLPLYLSLFVLVCLSFNSKGGNIWWFGIRKDFCTFLLTTCPCLREYGNISYSKQTPSHANSINTNLDTTNSDSSNNVHLSNANVNEMHANVQENPLGQSSPFRSTLIQPIASKMMTIESPD